MNAILISANKSQKNKRILLSLGMSFLIILITFILLLIKVNIDKLINKELMVREISLGSPPPPPPLTKQPREIIETAIKINTNGSGSEITINELDIKSSLGETSLDTLYTPDINSAEIQWNVDLEINWSGYGLDDLDNVPVLLTPLIIGEWPRALSYRGINKANIKLEVYIDEQGHLILIDVPNNQFPELLSSINQVINSTRFSIPKKSGQAVRARFFWSVEFVK